MKSRKIQLTCALCGETFKVFPSALTYANKRFCSNTCKNKMKSIEGHTDNICPVCNKPFKVMQCKAEARTHCSYACANKARTLGAYDLTFLNSDTPFRSWFLGWIMADGWLTQHGLLGLALIDKEIIDIMVSRTGYKNKVVKFQERKTKILGNTCTAKVTYQIQFRQAAMEKLTKLGFTPGAKTGKEFIPEGVSDKTFFHFLRGMFEGDGNFYVDDHKRLKFRLFCSSRQFLEDLLSRMEGLMDIRGGSIHVGPTGVYTLCFGHADSVRIAKAMYKDSDNMRLTRKYDKYAQAKDTKLNWTLQKSTCSHILCDRTPLAKNLCNMHYLRAANSKTLYQWD